MCDYNLHTVASRPAKVGDRLVTTKFDFLTRGFAAIGEPNVAVCLLPGTEVAFESEVERDHPFGRLLPNMQFGKLGDKVARFRQVNMDRPNAHRDALEFPNGQIVLVTRLCEGQRRRCCSCRPLPASRANRKSKCTPLLSPELSRSSPSGLRDGLPRASRVKWVGEGSVSGELLRSRLLTSRSPIGYRWGRSRAH